MYNICVGDVIEIDYDFFITYSYNYKLLLYNKNEK